MAVTGTRPSITVISGGVETVEYLTVGGVISSGGLAVVSSHGVAVSMFVSSGGGLAVDGGGVAIGVTDFYSLAINCS